MTGPGHAAAPAERVGVALAGSYAIERELGRGGMATVYLARDRKHARQVALKVLDPELGAVLGGERFLAEIRVTANLQHPNLLPLFDSGEADGLLFYVMPYVEGETLRHRLERERQLPVGEAVRIATAIAGALDYAHGHGVIHRDLKPENILLQHGQPVVADFGIALAVSNAGGQRVTQTGLSLGTPQYMSPEQATGDRVIDGRTDVYSLGAMLYEMLAGEPPHSGTTAQAVIAKLMIEAPRPLTVLRPSVPAHVEAAVRCALEKLPADRFATAREFAEALGGRLHTSVPRTAASAHDARPAPDASGRMFGVLRSPAWLVLFLLAAGVALWSRVASRPTAPGATVRFPLVSTPAEGTPSGGFAFSPDGATIVYSALGPDGVARLYARRMDAPTATSIAGTEGGWAPFFSPEGEWVAFFADEQLKKVKLDGGAPVVLAPLATNVQLGGTWLPNGRIVFTNAGRLVTVPDAGGRPTPVVTGDSTIQASQLYPLSIGDGRVVLFTRWKGSFESAQILSVSAESGKLGALEISGSNPLGIIEGQLIYYDASGSVAAVPFDVENARTTGAPVILFGVPSSSQEGISAAVSRTGSIVYQTGRTSQELVLSVGGAMRPLGAPRGDYSVPRFSPDGRRIAAGLTTGGVTDVVVYSLANNTIQRLTTGGGNERPEWAPDGTRVLFRSHRQGSSSIWIQRAGGGPASRLLTIPGRDIWQGVLTADGSTLIFRTGTLSGAAVSYRRLSGDTTIHPLTTRFAEYSARPSPDGKWIAFSSAEAGSDEVYVATFPGLLHRQQISASGGRDPVWAPDGRGIYYVKDDRTVAFVSLAFSPEPTVTKREIAVTGELSLPSGHAGFDVSPDGKALVLVRLMRSDVGTVVAHDWKHELRAATSRRREQ